MKHLVTLLLGCLLFATRALAQGTYTQIDVPGAAQTFAIGINSSGQISGSYIDNTVNNVHGFVLSDGIFTTIDYPGSSNTSLYKMNDAGQIVGVSLDPIRVGFLYDTASQAFSVISYPGADTTNPEDVNNNGTIVGFYEIGSKSFGFVLHGSTYTTIAAPRGRSSAALGISSSGEIVGEFSAGDVVNFAFYRGKYEFLRLPNLLRPGVFGINGSGTAFVGSYAPVSGSEAGFVADRTLGFEELQFPGSGNSTSASGVNDAGVVVGKYTDPNIVGHGFIWTPPATTLK